MMGGNLSKNPGRNISMLLRPPHLCADMTEVPTAPKGGCKEESHLKNTFSVNFLIINIPLRCP